MKTSDDRSQAVTSRHSFHRLAPVCGLLFSILIPAAQAAPGGFSSTGSLVTSRGMHSATLLGNGKVLVAGGFNVSGPNPPYAELYDPASGTWSTSGAPLLVPRFGHTATLLPDGRVLVAAGYTSAPTLTSTVELRDPVTGNWSATASLPAALVYHTATLLPNGKVLVAGGAIESGFPTNSAQLYDPATGNWSATGSLLTARARHTATLLSNGKVLVSGGGNLFGNNAIASAELYDPATGTWSATGSLGASRVDHSATLMQNGKVLAAGGKFLGTADIYDPATGVWTATGSLATGNRDSHGSTLLPDGRVLLVGGSTPVSEVYNPATGTWATKGTLSFSRDRHTTTLLGNGKVLVAGGWGSGSTLTSSELFEPDHSPDISLEQPTNTIVAVGGTRSFGATPIGSSHTLTFTVRNPGNAELTGLAITRSGTNADDFSVTDSPVAPVAAGSMTAFTVQFAPTSGSTGTRTAVFQIASNVTAKNPYTFNLTGPALSFSNDTDGDGLNDASEFNMSALGFDWQTGQPWLVTTLLANANGAGLYTSSQVRTIHLGTPLIERNPLTGQFKLTIGLKKSTDLTSFSPLPFTAPQITVNGAGRIEFLFDSADNTAFFQLGAE